MGQRALARTAKTHALRAVALSWAALTVTLSLIMAFPYPQLGLFIPVDGYAVVPPAMLMAALVVVALPLERVGDRVVRDFRAQHADGRLRNVADGLAIAIGESPEHVIVHDAEIPNVGGFPTTDGIVVMATSGAIELLHRDELEALVAAQFAGLRDPWCRLATRAELAWTFTKALGFASILFAVPIPVLFAATMVVLPRLVEATRDLCADVAAVAVTKHPVALSNAFRRLAPAAAVANQQKLVSHWYIPVSTFLVLSKRAASRASVGRENGPERTWTDVDEVRAELLLRADRAEALAAGADPRQFTGREFLRRWKGLGGSPLMPPPHAPLPPTKLPPPTPPPVGETDGYG